MKIIINVSSIFKGGAEQVAISFINECKTIKGNEYHVFLCENIGSQLNEIFFPDNFQFYFLDRRPGSGIINYFKAIRWFNKLEEKIKPDCVISTGGHGYWRPKAPLVGGFNIPHYVYPESPYFNRLSFRKRVWWYIKKQIDHFFYKRVDAHVVQTDDVNNRLCKWIDDATVFTVPNTVNSYFYAPEEYPDKLPKRKDGETRLLTLSSYYPHKNLEIINDVIEILKLKKIVRFRFILTIPEKIFQEKFDTGNQSFIYNIGPTPIKECPSLYKECDFMFLPTLLECFSASYAESMVMKTPILTSDLGFAHTVCGNAAIYFDPLDPVDIIEKIQFLTDHKDKQDELIAAGNNTLSGFNTPESRAQRFLSICREISK